MSLDELRSCKLRLSKTITSGYIGGVERIDHKIISSKTFPCCHRFENSLTDDDVCDLELDTEKGKMGIPKYDNSFEHIDYCPFCGTKIEIEVIKFIGKTLCPMKLRCKRYKLVEY